MSNLEELMLFQIKAVKLPEPIREYRFAAMHSGGTRKGVRARLKIAGLRDWRFDFCWLERKLAIECDGGTWNGGRHTRGKGYEEDCEKRNAATIQGWRVLNFTSSMIKSGHAISIIEKAFKSPRWQ